jgi:hypothetical protein
MENKIKQSVPSILVRGMVRSLKAARFPPPDLRLLLDVGQLFLSYLVGCQSHIIIHININL